MGGQSGPLSLACRRKVFDFAEQGAIFVPKDVTGISSRFGRIGLLLGCWLPQRLSPLAAGDGRGQGTVRDLGSCQHQYDNTLIILLWDVLHLMLNFLIFTSKVVKIYPKIGKSQPPWPGCLALTLARRPAPSSGTGQLGAIRCVPKRRPRVPFRETDRPRPGRPEKGLGLWAGQLGPGPFALVHEPQLVGRGDDEHR